MHLGLCMKHAAGVGPVERAACDLDPILAEVVDRRRQRGHAGEGTMSERASGEDPEPDLDLVEPATVLRREHKPNAWVMAEPLSRRVTGARADVVRDDDDAAFTVV